MVRRPTATCAGEVTGSVSIAYRTAPMNGLTSYRRYAAPLAAVALSVLAAAGCSGSRGPILGMGANAKLPPTVIASTPVNNTTAIVGNPAITATFNEAMAPLGATDFTVTCAAPCTSPTGTVT